MAEINKETIEQLTPEQLQELWLARQEDLEKIKSEASKWVNDYADRVVAFAQNFNEIKSDPKKLLDVEDEKLRSMYLKKVFDGKSLEEFKAELNTHEQETTEQLAERKALEIVEQQKVQEKVDAIIAKLPEDKVEKFQEELAFYTEWKKVDRKNINKFIKSALGEIQDDDGMVNVAKIYGMWWWTTTKSKTSDQKAIEERKAFALSI